MNILVLDDHYRDISPVLDVCLAGETIVYTSTPAQAEQKLQQQAFDVMLLDGDLGDGVTGPDVLMGWKAQGLALPPVVIFSADAEMRTTGVAAGAVDAIAKESLSFDEIKALKRFAPG